MPDDGPVSQLVLCCLQVNHEKRTKRLKVFLESKINEEIFLNYPVTDKAL